MGGVGGRQLLINKQILLSRNEVGERERERGKIIKKKGQDAAT